MRTPPFLLAAALLFWGWQTGHLFWGFVLSGALEAARVTRRRWEFSDLELKRIWLLCLALLSASTLIFFSTEDRMLFIFKLTQSLPVCLAPLMLAQAYGSRAALPLSIFSWPLPAPAGLSGARNFSYGYLAICVVGTSASTQANAFFYEGMAALVIAALAATRPRRWSWTAWSILVALVLISGFVGQQQLRRLQSALEGALGGLLASMLHQPADPRECRTLIGRQGEVPSSGRIVWRLTPDDSGFVPPLLREGVFETYREGTWSCSSNEFSPAARRGIELFRILPEKSFSFELRVAGYYDDGDGPLPMPHGCFEFSQVASPAQVRTNRLGCTDLNNAPGLVECDAHWGPGASLDPPPAPADFSLPNDEISVMADIVRKLGLKKMTPRQRVRAVERFFADGFRYTLNSSGASLDTFLTQTRVGHCEYFATATVLLLREAGIPARYVTGFAVPENARQGSMFLVRERHRHAWALAYHSDTGLWEDIDTTPAVWATTPMTAPPWWQSISDFGSDLYFRFSEWRWSKTSLARYASWLMVPLILSLLWRIIADQRGRLAARARPEERPPNWPGLDSELYLIDRRLAVVQLSRRPGETLALWQQRLENTDALPAPSRLQRVFELHRTLRFDPHGLSSPERLALKEEAELWLADFASQNNKSKTTRLFSRRLG